MEPKLRFCVHTEPCTLGAILVNSPTWLWPEKKIGNSRPVYTVQCTLYCTVYVHTTKDSAPRELGQFECEIIVQSEQIKISQYQTVYRLCTLCIQTAVEQGQSFGRTVEETFALVGCIYHVQQALISVQSPWTQIIFTSGINPPFREAEK